MRFISNLRDQGEIYLCGIKHFLINAYKITHLLNDDWKNLKKIYGGVISCVKDPLTHFYRVDVLKISAEECQIRMRGLPPGWKMGRELHPLSPFLYGAETCLQLFWDNAFAFQFLMKITKLDLAPPKEIIYPLECGLELGTEERCQIEWDLKTKGFCFIGINLYFKSQNREVGQLYAEIELTLPKALPSAD